MFHRVPLRQWWYFVRSGHFAAPVLREKDTRLLQHQKTRVHAPTLCTQGGASLPDSTGGTVTRRNPAPEDPRLDGQHHAAQQEVRGAITGWIRQRDGVVLCELREVDRYVLVALPSDLIVTTVPAINSIPAKLIVETVVESTGRTAECGEGV